MPQFYYKNYRGLFANPMFIGKKVIIIKIPLILIISKLKPNNNFNPGLSKNIQINYCLLKI